MSRIRADGTLAAWGWNVYGQCNVPAGNSYIRVAVGGSFSLALCADGTLVAWGSNNDGRCNVPAGNNFVAIAAGGYYSLALRADGSLVAWGYNFSGQCNVPAGNNFVAITCGWLHGMAIRTDGSLAAWGYNFNGQCNVPAGNNYVAIAAGQDHGLAMRSDGTLTAWGGNYDGQITGPDGFVARQLASLYIFTVVPSGYGEVAVGVPAGVAQGASLNPNAASNVLHTQVEWGGLKVTIAPTKAVTAGAQWRRVGTTIWLNSGASELTVAPGSTTVEFKSGVAGWVAPANQSMTVVKGQTATATGTYVRPSATLSSTAPNPTSTSPIPVTLTFSAAVTGFGLDELTLTNAIATGLAGSGTSYTFNLVPSQPGTVSVGLAGSTPLTRTYAGPASVIWVNFGWRAAEIGSQAQPFNTLTEGVAAVLAGGTIKLVGPNTSGEKLRITKAMRLEAVTGAVRIGVNGVAIPSSPPPSLAKANLATAPLNVPVELSLFQAD